MVVFMCYTISYLITNATLIKVPGKANIWWIDLLPGAIDNIYPPSDILRFVSNLLAGLPARHVRIYCVFVPMSGMGRLLATGAAAVAALLMGVGLVGMTVGDFQLAGFSFLSASLVIYLRETRLINA